MRLSQNITLSNVITRLQPAELPEITTPHGHLDRIEAGYDSHSNRPTPAESDPTKDAALETVQDPSHEVPADEYSKRS